MNSSNLPIDTVQRFVEIAGNDICNWQILYGRKVIHCTGGKGQVSMVAEVSSAIWVDYPSTSDVLSTFIVRYPKEQFIREFGEISPPFSIDTIQQHISKRNENIDNRSKLAYTKN